MRKSRLLLSLITLSTAAFMISLLVVGFLILQINRELPNTQSIQGIQLKVPLRVYSADKLLISEFGNERRKPIDTSNIPPILKNAVLAAEDNGFYEHYGIDFSGLIRAAISNFQTGKTSQGASTITMQVARNFFLSPEKTYIRKIKEILLSIKLEQTLTKDEIFFLYLNKIFLGHRAYGFGAAADVYYGKTLDNLNLAETAMLAGLPKAPSSYNPLRNPNRAIKRRNYVLGRLHALKLISDIDFQTAQAAPVTAQRHVKKTQLEAPHIAEMVRAQLTRQLGEKAYWQGLNVYTTITSKNQIAADKALRTGLQAYDRRHGFRGPIGKIDLDKVEITPENQDAVYLDLLSIYPSSHEQIPAVITATQKNSALAQTSDFGTVSLALKTSKWAKKHKTANVRGKTPTSMATLLSIGDVVYIQPIPRPIPQNNVQELADTQETAWRLSQIPNISGAIISMQPDSGRILSLVGGYDFFLNKFNRAVQSIRQPGSNIKPFIYSASLNKGFTPSTLISGAPIVITDPAHGTAWRPENYSGKFFGPTRMRKALTKSMNLVSIRLLRSIGIPYAREYIQRFGIDMQRFSPTLTMALGSGGVTPLEMLGAYSVLANGGYKVKPYFIEKITDRNGQLIYQAPQPRYCDECYTHYPSKPEAPDPNSETDTKFAEPPSPSGNQPGLIGTPLEPNYEAPRIMSRANNFLTVSMLKDVVRRGTARKALTLKRDDLAGKTGTTNNYVDTWFSGFNSKIATTVWVGFDDPVTMGRGEAGSRAALPIWIDYMRSAMAGIPEDTSELPEFIEKGYVNRFTGKRTDKKTDPHAIEEYFVIESLAPDYQPRPEHNQYWGLKNNEARTNNNQLGERRSYGLTELERETFAPPKERIIETSKEDTEGLF